MPTHVRLDEEGRVVEHGVQQRQRLVQDRRIALEAVDDALGGPLDEVRHETRETRVGSQASERGHAHRLVVRIRRGRRQALEIELQLARQDVLDERSDLDRARASDVAVGAGELDALGLGHPARVIDRRDFGRRRILGDRRLDALDREPVRWNDQQKSDSGTDGPVYETSGGMGGSGACSILPRSISSSSGTQIVPFAVFALRNASASA